MIQFSEYNYSEADIKARIGEIHNSQSNPSRTEALRTILNCIDLTSLNGNDTHEKIRTMCQKAYSFSNSESAKSATSWEMIND